MAPNHGPGSLSHLLSTLAVLVATGCDEPPGDVPPAPVVAPTEATPAKALPTKAPPVPVDEPAPGPATAAGLEALPEDPVMGRAGRAASVCARHADCRVLSGVCGRATPCNASSVETMREHFESVGRIATCGRGGTRVEDTTPACVRGACAALLGTPAEHRCEADTECTVLDGLCAPTEAVRSDQRGPFGQRIQAMKDRGTGCGYGPHPTTIRAVCSDGLCIPQLTDPTRSTP